MNDGMSSGRWPPVCRMSAHTWVTSPPQICVIAAWRAARFAWSLMMGSRCAAHVGTRVTPFSWGRPARRRQRRRSPQGA